MSDENFELNTYTSILEKINSIESTHEEWISALREILDEAIKKFNPACRAVYCIYTINRGTNTIHLEAAGANNNEYLSQRQSSNDVSISLGYIGRAIKSTHAYKVYNNVNDEGYICGNLETKSELVIKIPNLEITRLNTLLGVINLEANIEKAFDDKDGLLFSMIANWAGQFQNKKDNESQTNKILNYVSSLLSNYPSGNSNYLRRRDIFSKLGQISRDIAKSDAVAIALYETEHYNYEILFHEGKYPKIEQTERTFSVPSETFVANQRSTETIGEPTVHKYPLVKFPHFIESQANSELNYYLSVCFNYEFENTKKYAAIILGFKEKDVTINDSVLRELKFLAKNTSQAIKKLEQIDDRELLVSAINSLYDINTGVRDLHVYLQSAARQLCKSVDSTGCVFYQLIDENSDSGITLRDIGSEFRIESNIFWRDHFKQHVDKFKELEHGQSSSVEFPITVSSQHDSKEYNIYARTIELHKTIIFVSLKQLQDYHKDLKLSEIHQTVLNVKIKFIESFVKNWTRGNSIDYSLDALKKVMNSWLQTVVDNNHNNNDSENLLFKAVHSFLQDWNRFAGTEYSAIFLFSETTLTISDASMDHLGAKNDTCLNVI